MEILKYVLYAVLALLGLGLAYVLSVVVASFFVDMEKPLEKQSRFFRKAVDILIPFFVWVCGGRPDIEGMEKMPEGKFLMVCNHRSMFDPLTVMARFQKYNIAYISKPENMKIPVVGPGTYATGSLAIDRENNREALKTIIRAAEQIKSGMCNMMIYPEGTRSRSGELLDFHAGSFKIAQRAGCDLVICAIDGSEKVTKRLFRPTKVVLSVLETLPADKVKSMNTEALAEYSKNLIANHLASRSH